MIARNSTVPNSMSTYPLPRTGLRKPLPPACGQPSCRRYTDCCRTG